VTTQQSRFHADVLEAPESKEIDVKDLTVSIGGHDVLNHTPLRLRERVHYVLAGREGSLDEQDARALLGQLGLRGKVVSDVPLGALSGGQRVRLALAEVLWSSPHLLVLDEVTTHLDLDTIVALIRELQGWEGALVVVTHDRYFTRGVVEREPVDLNNDENEDSEEEPSPAVSKEPGVVYRLRNGELKKLDGGMQRYEELARKTVQKLL